MFIFGYVLTSYKKRRNENKYLFYFLEYKFSMALLFPFYTLLNMLCCVLFLSILNFGYFIRKVKEIYGISWLVEHKVEQKICIQ